MADVRSVSGAALALDLHQSVVSRKIAQIEMESGARLFHRKGRGVVLTEFGEQVYPRIVGLIRESDQLADDMRTRSCTPMGDVRFGMLPSSVQAIPARRSAPRAIAAWCGPGTPGSPVWRSGSSRAVPCSAASRSPPTTSTLCR
ncbi:LysR family transcriptional regulator [Variovorax sp. YR216]|uniref:LysR family transcriptional regulator n=1 Tax=Variovorax sp. YR216 TaxID=1882828 RepID=UPI0035257FA1